MRDLYEIIGVDRGATDSDIKEDVKNDKKEKSGKKEDITKKTPTEKK